MPLPDLPQAPAEDHQEARRWLQDLLHREWPGDGSETYDQAFHATESFMVGGGGPTGWLRFVIAADPDEGERVLTAFLHYTHAGPDVMIPVPEWSRSTLLQLCRADVQARLVRERVR